MTKKLSEQAWNNIQPIFDAIINHPFNQELTNGSLEINKFAYYMEQDGNYLPNNLKCDSLIAGKIKQEYIDDFIQYSDDTLQEEQNVIDFFNETQNVRKIGSITSAAVGYSSYILSNCANEPVEVAVAAILPCLWIYREVGIYVFNNSVEDNPYAKWINIYSDEEYSKSVDEAIAIFDDLASSANIESQQKMLLAFNQSSLWEWHFFDNAYSMEVF